MSVVIEKAGRQIPLQRGSKITLESQSHEQIKILNQQGHTPKDLIVKRNEKDLVLSSDDEDFEIVLADFFEQTNTEVLLDIPTDAGLTQTAITPQTEVLLASTITDTSSPSFGLISLGVLAGILTVSAVGLGSGGGSGGNNNTVPDNSNNLNNIPDNNKQNNPNDNGQNNNNQDNGDQGGSDSGDNPPAIQNVELQITKNDDGGLTITGKAEPNTKVEIDVDGDGNPESTVDTDENGNFNTTVNKEDLPTEKEQLEVTATAKDEEDNEVGEPATEIIDNPAYVNEELTVTLETNIGGEDNIINSEEAEQDQTVEIKVEGLQDGETPVFKIDETGLSSSPKADSDNVWEVTIPKEKLYTDEGEGKSVTISVTGDKGSEGNVEAPYSVDITAPEAPAFNDPQYNSDAKTLTISGTAEPGSTVKVTVGDQDPKEVEAKDDGSFEAIFENIEQSNEETGITVNATATDTAGNTSEEAEDVATIPPISSNPTTTNNQPVIEVDQDAYDVTENKEGAVITESINVSDEDGDDVTLAVSGDDRFEVVKNDNGTWKLQLKDGKSLDYEIETEITLTLTADDGKGEANSIATQEITINVKDDTSDNPTTPNQLTVNLQTNNIGGDDNVINIEEATADTQTVEIKVEGLQDGEKPVFKIDEEELSGSLKDGSESTYTVAIPKANLELETGEDKIVTISVTGDKGSTGDDVEAKYAVDVTAPEKPAFNDPQYNSDAKTLTISGTAEKGATVEVTVGDQNQKEVTADENGKFEVTFENIEQGEQAQNMPVTATATDTAGNTSDEAATTATIPAANDNPPTPTLSNDDVSVALAEDTGSNKTDGITKTGNLKVNGVDGQKWVYSLDGTNWIAGSESGTIAQEDLGGDGVKNVRVSLSQDGKSPIDNPKSFEFTLDTQVAAPSISSSYNKDTQVLTVSGTAEANSTIKLSVAGNTQTVSVGNNGSFSKDFNVARQDTDFIPGIKATITDKAGNIDSSYEQPANVTIPANLNNRGIKLSLVNDSGMGGDRYTNQADFNVSGVDGQQWVYRVDNGAWQVGSDNKITGITGEGQHLVEVSRSEDGTNPIDINTYLPEGFNVILDTVGASVSNLQATPNGNQVTVSGKTEANLQVTIEVGDKTDTATADSNGNFSKVITVTQTENQQNLNVSATPAQDKAGNNGITANGNVTIDALPQTDDKVEQARQAITELQAAVTRAEQDGTVEHDEYSHLNTLRDAAKAAVQAVGESDSAYQELKDDLNSAANYVRGTTFEHAKDVVNTYNTKINDGSSFNRTEAQKVIDALNAGRSMNGLSEVHLSTDDTFNNWTQAGVNTGVWGHNSNNSTGSSVLSNNSETPVANLLDDSDDYNKDTLGHRVQLLNPRLDTTSVGISNSLSGITHYTAIVTLPNHSQVPSTLYAQSGYNTPDTIEWPAEGYLPYSMMPNSPLGGYTGTYVNGEIVWTAVNPQSVWSFSALGQSLNNATVSVSLNGSAFKSFATNQITTIYTDYRNGWNSDDDYHTIAFNMGVNAIRNPGDQVDDYFVEINATGYSYSYHIYVFNDVAAAQNHANKPVSLLSNEIQQPDNLSGNLNNEAIIYTGTEDNDVVQVAELVATAKVELGSGDDVVEINHYLGGDIDGGDGFDTVVLTGGANALSGNHLNGIEAIDLGSTERDNPNVVSLTANDLINNHDENGNLWISGQAGDRVALFEGIVESDTTVENADGVVFHQYTYTADNTTYAVLISDELHQNGGVVI